MSQRRIYLDNAATSFPKPPGVYDAMMDFGLRCGASPGRGHYAESRQGAGVIRRCRERLHALLGGDPAVSDGSHVVFALNTSDALNLAIKGVWRQARLDAAKSGDARPLHVVTSAMDHNSVLRPFLAMQEEGVRVTIVEANSASGVVSPHAIEHALMQAKVQGLRTILVACNWVSNVTGTIQHAAADGTVARICRNFDMGFDGGFGGTEGAAEIGVPYLIDVAQGLGHAPFNAVESGADLIAFPGHKGLLGPQGTGGLYVRPGFEYRLATSREGGTGSMSELDWQPTTMPEKYEAGSHNTIGIAGLSEAVAWIQSRTVAAMRAHELELIEVFLRGLRQHGCQNAAWPENAAPVSRQPLSNFTLLGPVDPALRVGTFSFVHQAKNPDEMTYTPGELAAMLEQSFGVLSRAGLHCAPRAHAAVGSLDAGTLHHTGTPLTKAQGALRLSFGAFNTVEDAREALRALVEIGESTVIGSEPELVRP